MCIFIVVFWFWDFDITIYICTKLFWVPGLLISNALSMFCICPSLFSCLLILISYQNLSVSDFLLLYYLCLYQWAFSFIIFLFLIVAFSFLPREVPLVVIGELVWSCWILLLFLVWKAFDTSVKSAYEPRWVKYFRF